MKEERPPPQPTLDPLDPKTIEYLSRDLPCHECGKMMTNHIVVTRHESGACDESFHGPPLRNFLPDSSASPNTGIANANPDAFYSEHVLGIAPDGTPTPHLLRPELRADAPSANVRAAVRRLYAWAISGSDPNENGMRTIESDLRTIEAALGFVTGETQSLRRVLDRVRPILIEERTNWEDFPPLFAAVQLHDEMYGKEPT